MATARITPNPNAIFDNIHPAASPIERFGLLPVETIYLSTMGTEESVNGHDYTRLSGFEHRAALSVAINDDTTPAQTEPVGIVAPSVAVHHGNGPLASGLFVMPNDDPTAYSVAAVTVQEADGLVTFTVTRTGLLPDETVYATTTQDQGFTNHSDFADQIDTLIHFADGQITAELTFAVTDDTWFQHDQTYGLLIQRDPADPNTTFLAQSTFTIIDNEAPILLSQYPVIDPQNANRHVLIGSPRNPNDGGISTPGSPRQWTFEISTRGQTGWDVHAVADGTVIMVRDDLTDNTQSTTYGNTITIQADNGFYYSMHHLEAFSATVAEGDRVTMGEVIAQSSDSGSADEGPHFHMIVGSHLTMIELYQGDPSTREIVPNGKYDDYAPVYYDYWKINYRDDPSVVTYYGAQGVDDFNGNDLGDRVQGFAANDTLRGGALNDFLDGGDDDDSLIGNAGNDKLIGGTGADSLDGGDGNDTLFGREGADTLIGGAGAETFVFDTPLDAVDTIVDFASVDDRFALDNAIFTAFGTSQGLLPASNFAVGSAALDATDRIIYDPATGALYYDADGTGATAQVQFALLAPGLTLVSADFLVYHLPGTAIADAAAFDFFIS